MAASTPGFSGSVSRAPLNRYAWDCRRRKRKCRPTLLAIVQVRVYSSARLLKCTVWLRQKFREEGEVEKRERELSEALVSLLSDIEAMYQGEELFGGQSEEFFGPFSIWELDAAKLDTHARISWPCLAISMRKARDALRNMNGGNASDVASADLN